MVILAHELLPLHPMADHFHWPIRSYCRRPLPLPHPHDRHEAIHIRCLFRITTLFLIILNTMEKWVGLPATGYSQITGHEFSVRHLS